MALDIEKTEKKSQNAQDGISLTVDVVIFSLRPRHQHAWEAEDNQGRADDELQVLLVRRARAPFQDYWALPGGRVRAEENLEEAAARQLREKTALRASYLEQLYTFGRKDRDPRGRTISVAYYALVRTDREKIEAGRDTAEARWFPADELPPEMAFDHAEILGYALWRLRNKIKYANIAFQFLPPTFTLTQLREVYDKIQGRNAKKEDPANFKRKVEASGVIIETNERLEGGRHRPPRLYRAVVTPPNDPYQRGPIS
ncbi:MAG TPA: NUDIX domain-containing protein [Chloroflexia bacterium]|nr:NUDIX domain-containing protein [Chloroflexia bacterium]